MISSNKDRIVSTKKRPVFWRVSCCLLFCLMPAVLAQDKPVTRLLIPGGPPDVYLTMPLKELLAQRKNIKDFSIFDDRPPKDRQIDPESKRGMLLEHYKNTQFQDAVYFIQDGKLLGLGAYSEYQGKIPAAVRQKFLSDVVKAYGQPDGAVVVKEAKSGIEYNIPMLLWHLPSANIGVELTPDKINSLAPEESLIGFRMFSPEYYADGGMPLKELPYNFAKLTEQQRKAILEPLQAAVKKIH